MSKESLDFPEKKPSPANQPWPHDWMMPFLLHLRADGNVGGACQAAGISRVTAYTWRAQFERFRRAWDEAVEDAIDELEAECRRRALAGSDVLLWKMLSSLRRNTYGERIEIEHTLKQYVKSLAEQFQLTEDEILAEAERILSGKSELNLHEGAAPHVAP